MGSRAAKSAAQTQSQAAEQQAQSLRDLLAQYNPAIGTSAEQARSDVLDAAKAAGVNLTDVAERGAAGITGAAGQANEFLAPYLQLGQQGAQSLSELMAPGGQLNRNFTFQDMQALDPGYQFRIDQANKALAGSAAARGGALGGGAIRSAMNLSQNLASSEYGAAFDRFRAQNTDRFSRFSNLVDLGARTGQVAGGNLMTAAQQASALRTGAAQTAGGWDIGAGEYGGNAMMNAAQTMAGNAMSTGRSIADLMTSGAAAKAAGTMGTANAWSGALGGIANTAGQVGRYYQQKQMMEEGGDGGGDYGGYGGYGSYGSYGRPSVTGQMPYGYTPPTLDTMMGGSYGNPAIQRRRY